MLRITACLLALIIPLVLLIGCAARHTVILVPNPDGTVGKAEVVTAGGKQVLEKANGMTSVSGSAAPPSPVTTADSNYIATTFSDALGIEQIPSEKFILFFNTATVALTPRSQKDIAAVVEAIKRRNSIIVTISGHTDAVGSAQLNDKLARNRAERVQELLLQHGVSQQVISVSSHGKGNPLIPTPDGVAEPKNRRVEVIVR
jgi:outer membrane protein OmpA-like peptidoglycan-associated protein